MSWFEKERLELQIARVQLEIEKLRTQYLVYTCSLLSLMVVIDIFLFLIGVHIQEGLWFILALCITISFILLVNIVLERWFLTNIKGLRIKLDELEEGYLL
jgi:hypothetical protein